MEGMEPGFAVENLVVHDRDDLAIKPQLLLTLHLYKNRSPPADTVHFVLLLAWIAWFLRMPSKS